MYIKKCIAIILLLSSMHCWASETGDTNRRYCTKYGFEVDINEDKPILFCIIDFIERCPIESYQQSLAFFKKDAKDLGPHLEEHYGGRTPLRKAVKCGHLDVCSALLEAKAQVNAVVDDGNTALMDAVETGNSHIVRLLLDVKAETDYIGTSQYPESLVTPLQRSVLKFMDSPVKNRSWSRIAVLLHANGAQPSATPFNPKPSVQEQLDAIAVGQKLLPAVTDKQEKKERS